MKSLSTTLFVWFKISRPILYPLIPITFLLGYQSAGESLWSLTVVEWLFVATLTWPVSMILYGINDIFDYETDRVTQTRNNIDGSIVNHKQAPLIWRGVSYATAILIGVGSLAYGVYGGLFGLCVFVASCLYSMPPLRIKSRPILDVLFSGTAYAGGMYTAGYIVASEQFTLPSVTAYILILFAVSLHALGTLRDYTADCIAHNITTAVFCGPRITAGLVAIMTTIGMFWWFLERGIDIIASTLFLTILIPALATIWKPNEYLIQQSLYIIVFAGIIVGAIKVIL